MLSCACECVYCQCVIGVCELDVKATDFSVSTGLNWSRSLKTHKAEEAYLKKLNTVEGSQVTKCIFLFLFCVIVLYFGLITASE